MADWLASRPSLLTSLASAVSSTSSSPPTTADLVPSPAAAPANRPSRAHRLALAAVLAAAALLRLVYAWPQPDPSRFWDERYGFRNVAAILIDGSAVPQHALYPTLSWLPHTALLAASEGLHRATGVEGLSIHLDREERLFSPTAYRLARLVSVLVGVWAVWLLYRLGGRVLDPAVGLVAALLLAGFWRHVIASVEFKPDSIAVALTLVAAGWSLRAVRRGSWPAFLLAGAGIGLATAAKYNAALVAMVLAAAVAAEGRGAVRLLPKLAGAAAASVAVFFALDPWPSLVLRDFRWQVGYYALEAERAGSGHGSVLVAAMEFLLRHHGPALAACAVAGLAVLGWRAVRAPREHRELIPVLVFAAGYPLVYAAVTRLFLGQNLLPVVPFTCLFAAWAIVAGGRALAARWRPFGSPAWRAAGFAVLAVLVLRLPVTATHAELVPSTSDHAAALLAGQLGPIELRVAFHERAADEPPIRPRTGGRWLPVVPVGDLRQVEAAELALADAEVFPAERLQGSDAAFWLRRVAAPSVRVERLPARFLATRGRELVAVLHPWRELGPPVALEPERTVGEDGTARLRAIFDGPAAPGEAVSIGLTVPNLGERPPLEGLSLARRPLAWYSTGGRGGGRVHLISERRRLDGDGPHELVALLPRPPGAAPPPALELHRWQPPGTAAVPGTIDASVHAAP